MYELVDPNDTPGGSGKTPGGKFAVGVPLLLLAGMPANNDDSTAKEATAPFEAEAEQPPARSMAAEESFASFGTGGLSADPFAAAFPGAGPAPPSADAASAFGATVPSDDPFSSAAVAFDNTFVASGGVDKKDSN